jgi:hypothetical protein
LAACPDALVHAEGRAAPAATTLRSLARQFRIVLGAIGSALGSVPVGNTGGTDVSMFKRMQIRPDLWQIMADGESNATLAPKRHASAPKCTADTP